MKTPKPSIGSVLEYLKNEVDSWQKSVDMKKQWLKDDIEKLEKAKILYNEAKADKELIDTLTKNARIH